MRRHIPGRRDRIRQLRVFCEVARTGSITTAAERLGLTQPAVSSQIRELEYEHGAMLLERRVAGVALTDGGELLYGLAEPLVQGVENLFDDPQRSLDAGAAARLRLAATRVGHSLVLPRYLRRFHDRFPDIPVRVDTASVKEGLERLLDERVDLVFGIEAPLPGDSINYRQLFTYGLVLITPPGHPLASRKAVSPQEASEYSAVVPSPELYSQHFDESPARTFSIEANAVAEVGSWEMVRRYVEVGIGIAVVPSLCVSETDRLPVIALDTYFGPRSYGVFTLRDRLLPPPARHFLKMLTPDATGQPAGNTAGK